MSIISWTSPVPSDTTLPVSIVTRRPRSSLAMRNSSARIRTNSPRRGAGTVRQASNASAARPIIALAASGLVSLTWVMSSPVIGDLAAIPSRANVLSSTPSWDKMASASSRTDVHWSEKAFVIAPSPRNADMIRPTPVSRTLGRSGSPRKSSTVRPLVVRTRSAVADLSRVDRAQCKSQRPS